MARNEADDEHEVPLKENKVLIISVISLFIIGAIAGVIYYSIANTRVYIEKAEVNAPLISLAPVQQGVLEKLYVNEGDYVSGNHLVARVGNSEVKTKTEGRIVDVLQTPGQIVSAQTPVAKMIDPREFRIVGRVSEDKGLQYIKPGQKAMFTVDAFGPRKYYGIVDAVTPTARQSDIVFSISDKREEREFDVKVKFDYTEYRELMNGMSAKLWIYKN